MITVLAVELSTATAGIAVERLGGAHSSCLHQYTRVSPASQGQRKAVRAHLGQALRGPGDLYAWTDHAAYLTRSGPGGERLRLTLERRAAPALEPLELRLVSSGDGSATHLEVVSSAASSSRTDIPPAHTPGLALDERVVERPTKFTEAKPMTYRSS